MNGAYVIFNALGQPVSKSTTLIGAKDKVSSLGRGAYYKFMAVGTK